MDIKIEGNPGTGNTFQEINIGTVHNFNPNATTIINNYGISEERLKEKERLLGDPWPLTCNLKHATT